MLNFCVKTLKNIIKNLKYPFILLSHFEDLGKKGFPCPYIKLYNVSFGLDLL